MSIEISLLITLVSLIAITPVALQVRRALLQVQMLRDAVEAGPVLREVRYTLREMIVVPASPKVVAFPVRSVPAPGQSGHWRKAA